MTHIARCLCGPRASVKRFVVIDAPARSAKNDPTGTMPLQRRWVNDLDQRWASVKKMVPHAIQLSPIDYIRQSSYTGTTSPVQVFQKWLDEALKQVVLGGNGAWTLPYIRQATDLGVNHANQSVSDKAVDVGPADRTHLLQALVITELQGVIEAVSQQAVRAYANGLLSKQSPTQIASAIRQVIDSIGGHRGKSLISFMTVRSFAAASLDGFRARGVKRVGIIPEKKPKPVVQDAKPYKGMVNVRTAEDNLVCDECDEISQEGPYYIDEAEALIPAHPNCRCAFEPADDEEYADFTGEEKPDEEDVGDGSTVVPDASKHRHAPVVVARVPTDGNLDWSGVHATLARGRVRDDFNPDEPRDQYGKWTTGGGGGGDVGAKAAAITQGMKAKGYSAVDISHYRPGSHGSKQVAGLHTFEVSKEAVGEFNTQLASHGLEATKHDNLSSNYFNTYSVAPKQAAPVATDHPSQKYLKEVKGNSKERVAMRKELKTKDAGTPIHSELQHQIIASMWKQHTDLTSAGKTEKASDIANKLEKRAKDYGVTNPLKGDVKVGAKLAGGMDVTKAAEVAKAATPGIDKIGSPTEAKTLAKVIQKVAPSVKHFPAENKVGSDKLPEIDKNSHSFAVSSPDEYKAMKEVLSNGGYKIAEEYTANNDSGKLYGVKVPVSYEVKHEAPAPKEEPKPKYDITTPHGNFMQSLHENGVSAETYPSSIHSGHNILLHSSSDFDKADEIAKYHPKIENVGPGLYKTKTSEASSSTPDKHEPPATQHAPHSELTFSDLTKVGEKMGSNEGGTYQDKNGTKYYVKSMDEAHAKNELLAAKLYALAGSKTLNYVPVKSEGDKHFVATKLEKLEKDNIQQLDASEKKNAQHDFATHAWLANWDAAGTGGDNQGVLGGKTTTLDVGGSLEYRAKGTPKGTAFGDSVNEWETLRNSSKNADAANLYGKMTDAQLKASAAKVTSIAPSQIVATVQSVYGTGPKSNELSTKLIARRNDINEKVQAIGKQKAESAAVSAAVSAANKAAEIANKPEEEQRYHWLQEQTHNADQWVSLGQQAIDSKKWLQKTGITKTEVGFIKAFTGPHSSVNESMRNGDMSDSIFAFKHIMNEALAKMPAYDGDAVYRKISIKDAAREKYQPGKIIHWQAFSSTSKTKDTWSGNTHFTIQKPTSGVDVASISSHPSESEVIMPADTYYRVISRTENQDINGKHSPGTTHIVLQEATPFGKKKKAT